MEFTARDGIQIHYEATGTQGGEAIIFAHEFAAELKTWYPQFLSLIHI